MLPINKNMYWLLILFITLSCEEVIEIDLNSSKPVIVAEGVIEKDSTAWIKLSYTSDYFTSEESVKISDAVVQIVNESGNSETLIHIGNGYYKGSKIIGSEEGLYTLSMQINNETYSATTTINNVSEIISVSFEETEMRRQNEDAKYGITITFTDVKEENNFYMIKLKVNNILETDGYNLINGELYNNSGIIEYAPLMSSFDLNDKIEIFLYSIDEDTYTYYSQLNDDNAGMMGSSTPYTPKSNFGVDVLGYFAGWSTCYYKTTVNDK
ncbi:MAG: DUF4249 domain-containing protein [Bacteroidales bacterium]|nr:DUF4249 domain-containing protein [Bacteroidales bacterium]